MKQTTNSQMRAKVVRRQFWRKAVPMFYKGLIWAAMIIGWFVVFGLVVDMPNEYKLRHSVDDMRDEYEKLETRYNTLTKVLDNVIERDANVFRTLFQSNPYDLNDDDENSREELNAVLLDLDNAKLQEILDSRIASAKSHNERLLESYVSHSDVIVADYMNLRCMPSIQPVNNSGLTLLASGKKSLLNPFHRTMTEHNGVDYLVPEGTAVFATADGSVESLSEKNSTRGKAITINHGNGYKTTYCHLQDIRVSEGDRVRRGDIIALSGNTGLSFAPHLHYEVRFRGAVVDPVHYFFMELSPEEYQRIISIALSSMQSFD